MSDAPELYSKLYDKNIISDLRIKDETADNIYFGVKRSKYVVNIPKSPTTEIAYLAGAIAGDGCFHIINSKDRNFPRVKITITSGDKTYLNLLNSMFIRNFDVGGKIFRDKRKNSCYDLHINHRVIWLYFRNVLGLNKSSLSVPSEFTNPTLFRFFLAGFFDTDGYLNNRGIFGVMMSGKNSGFLSQLTIYSKDFYGLDFSPVKTTTLKVNPREFERSYTRLRKNHTQKFLSIVPLLNKKYEWARRESNPRSSLFSLHTPQMEGVDVRATS